MDVEELCLLVAVNEAPFDVVHQAFGVAGHPHLCACNGQARHGLIDEAFRHKDHLVEEDSCECYTLYEVLASLVVAPEHIVAIGAP